jgi:hypothetical protein
METEIRTKSSISIRTLRFSFFYLGQRLTITSSEYVYEFSTVGVHTSYYWSSGLWKSSRAILRSSIKYECIFGSVSFTSVCWFTTVHHVILRSTVGFTIIPFSAPLFLFLLLTVDKIKFSSFLEISTSPLPCSFIVPFLAAVDDDHDGTNRENPL